MSPHACGEYPSGDSPWTLGESSYIGVFRLTAIFAKIAITGVSSSLATAIRTIIILPVAWGIVLAKGEAKGIASLSRQNLIFLVIVQCNF